MEQLPLFPAFDCDADRENAGTRWTKWVDRLENLFVGLKIDDSKRKRALLLHYAGERVYDIYSANKGDSAAEYDDTKKVLNEYFAPKKNIQIEIFKFRACKQKDTQTLDEYVTELRRLAKNCEFANTDQEILSQLIQCCKSTRLRRRALRESDKTLKDILTMGRTLEMADNQAALIERDPEKEMVQKVQFKPKSAKKSTKKAAKKSSQDLKKTTCRNCGGEYPHQGKCPAFGKICNFCKKSNHFKSVCKKLKRKEKVANVTEHKPNTSDSSEEDDYCYSVEFVGKVKSVPTTELMINQKPCQLLIDTGASVNILDEKTYTAIGSPKLKRTTNSKLMPYGGNKPLNVKGECTLTVETQETLTCQKFFVVPGNNGSLLGFETAKDLNLVKIIGKVDSSPCEKFPELFNGIGKLKGQKVKLHINENVKPVANCHRRTPFHLREKVEKELNKLLAEDIIEKVDGVPTPWVSPIVTPPKKDPDEIRLCVDMREPNKAILRERHLLPTTEELIHDLNGATVFSKLDLRSGYHQLELEESSRYITTFNTHAGMFRYKRLNFGISSASEVFQETIRKVLQGIQGAKNISDDIIIFGKTQGDHDRALTETFKRLQSSGLTLNRKKCEFNKDRIEFFGMVFSGNGISPDPKKVESIKQCSPPKDVKELRSFLGMTSYSSRFIKDYATVCEPLRRLTRKDEPWNWGQEQQKAFQTLQDRLSSDSVMAYFNPTKDMKVIVDASPVGLGAILQQEKIVAYASRALSDVESRYSQTEREALAIVWACEHFDIYLRGAKQFTVITDHKPLEKIWSKANPPLRIQRWGLRLQPYKLNIKYEPGAENPADYMSRHPHISGKSKEEDMAEKYIHFIANEATPRAITLDEIKAAVLQDETILQAIEFTKTGEWFKLKNLTNDRINLEELKALASVRDELTVYTDNVLLKDNKLVLPKSLRKRSIEIAHEGHQGMTKTKSFLRSKIWFPKMNSLIEEAIKGCYACQLVTPEQNPMTPLNMSDLPSEAWQNLSADFCGPLPTGDYLFVIMDEYSRYPVVETVKSTSANALIPILDKVLSEFGFPKVIKTDNGSPFNSGAFKAYTEDCGIEHRRITPRWPRANAQAESFNKPLMKAIRAAHATGQNWKQQLYKFLRQYRATPHAATGFTPYRMLFKREPKTRLPSISCNVSDRQLDEQARRRDDQKKTKSKEYADKKNGAHYRPIDIGDRVLVKRDQKGDKLSTTYCPQPYTVSAKSGNMITATKENGGEITRNSSRFKKLDTSVEIPDPIQTPIDEETEDVSESTPPPKVPTPVVPEPPAARETGPRENTANRPRPQRSRREPVHFKDYIKY